MTVRQINAPFYPRESYPDWISVADFLGIEKSIDKTHPRIVREWHPTKNGNLRPKDVLPGSNKKVWWKCKYGHEWEAMVNKRTNRERPGGCPYCSGHKVGKDNCISTTHPGPTKEWHPTKNGKLTPDDVSAGSNKRVWWRCKNKHEWEAVVVNRTKGKGNKCPYCSGRRASKENCLTAVLPELAKEWHPTKNGELTPDKITRCAAKKVWWKCEDGHEWEATVANRKNGCDCPYCSNQKIGKDNCLSTTHPELAKEWHPTKNGKLTPKDVSAGSTKKKFWWKCAKGHEWQITAAHRANGRCCPYCLNKKVCKDNCFATTHPELAKEWHPTKNKEMTPTSIVSGSNKRAWWKCRKKHIWQTRVADRTRRGGTGCPHCYARR